MPVVMLARAGAPALVLVRRAALPRGVVRAAARFGAAAFGPVVRALRPAGAPIDGGARRGPGVKHPRVGIRGERRRGGRRTARGVAARRNRALAAPGRTRASARGGRPALDVVQRRALVLARAVTPARRLPLLRAASRRRGAHVSPQPIDPRARRGGENPRDATRTPRDRESDTSARPRCARASQISRARFGRPPFVSVRAAPLRSRAAHTVAVGTNTPGETREEGSRGGGRGCFRGKTAGPENTRVCRYQRRALRAPRPTGARDQTVDS